MTALPTPPGAVDTHAHVLDASVPSSVEGAAYGAFDAPVSAYLRHLDAVGAERGVLVNPSTYGTDHRVLLDALRAHADRLRGVAVVPADVGDEVLDELHDAGVRGCRVQDRFAGGAPLEAMRTLLERVGPRGWHVQVWTDVSERLPVLLDAARLGLAPIVVDHLGFVPAPDDGAADAGTAPLLELLATGNCWVKLSGAYRLAAGLPEPAAARRVAARVEAVLRAAPDRVVWGSDWPYVACPGPRPEDADHVTVLDSWLSDPGLRRRALAVNPARLYDWTTPAATR